MAQLLTEFLLPMIRPKGEPGGNGRRWPVYTREEVLNHCSREDCWLIIDKQVYNVTSYLTKHAGGQYLILEHAGRDATTAFKGKGHSSSAWKLLKTFKIGELQRPAQVLY